jgi:TctA family transporter
MMFICIGVFSVNNSAFDVMLVMIFGIIGYIMLLLKFEPAPMLLGFILGPLMEEHLRRAMLLSRGDPMVFLERPISGTMIVLTAAVLCWAFYTTFRQRGTPAVEEAAPSTTQGTGS